MHPYASIWISMDSGANARHLIGKSIIPAVSYVPNACIPPPQPGNDRTLSAILRFIRDLTVGGRRGQYGRWNTPTSDEIHALIKLPLGH
ncbi:hypothetical protein ACN42_g7930 [Penicillium freii]|uniref:Uncharacterized protein n=1 Tax=Penicillium freii TaxID=48697 RepID=A0A124GQU0_PENFR|nr:hypothetical protein ACN42_g7930 [Penicillium freii]